MIDFHKGLCPKCGCEQRSIVLAKYAPGVHSWSEGEFDFWANEEYRILECGGCETRYFQERHQFSEDQDIDHNGKSNNPWSTRHYPPPESRTKPIWTSELSADLEGVMDEVYRALDSSMPILAAAGMRTALDTAIEQLKIDSNLTFNRKLEELERLGFIGDTERRTLTHLVDAGNSAIHRGWRPSPDHLNAIRESLEIFLQRTFVADKRLQALTQKLPPKGASKAAGNPKATRLP